MDNLKFEAEKQQYRCEEIAIVKPVGYEEAAIWIMQNIKPIYTGDGPNLYKPEWIPNASNYVNKFTEWVWNKYRGPDLMMFTKHSELEYVERIYAGNYHIEWNPVTGEASIISRQTTEVVQLIPKYTNKSKKLKMVIKHFGDKLMNETELKFMNLNKTDIISIKQILS